MSEEKTKIVPRSQPKLAGEQITFSCDNGHRIVVPLKLAGKRGTCSKCGIAVVIPALSPAGGGEPQPEAEKPETPAFAPPAGDDQAAQASEPEPPAAEPPNEFAGLFDAVSAEQSRNAGGGAAMAADAGAVEEAVDAGASGSGVGNVLANEAREDYAEAYDGSVAADNPTAQLVARLWAEREHGGIVEIHIAGGGVILPQWYEPQWSRGTHGLFAGQAADGTVTLTAVAWDSIQKIVVRQVEGLPDGMFE